jgi:error-prone DNA polymerase
MYPRRLILEDARRHGIPILALDVNLSEREYVVEEVDGSEQPFGIRLALQDVHGIDDSHIRSILAGRADKAFRDVPDSLRADRRGNLYAAMTTQAQREGDQMTLADAAAPLYRFKDYSDAEVVRAELQVLGMDASRHIISFFEPLLTDLGVTRTRDLSSHRGGEKVMVAGVKVASQTPAIRSGQRIIFLTLDDATGLAEVTVFESVQPKVAKTVFHSYAMAVWGELRRTGAKGVSVIAEEIWDLTELHHARGRGELAQVMAGTTGSGTSGLPQASSPSRALWHASGGSAG